MMTAAKKIRNKSTILTEAVPEAPRPKPQKAMRSARVPHTTRPMMLRQLVENIGEWLKVEVAPTADIASSAASWYRRGGDGLYSDGVLDADWQAEDDGTYSVFAKFNGNNKKKEQ